jgi:hypothetical protein
MTKNVQYVSDATKFISAFLKKHPEVIEKQKSLRDTWWDIDLDAEEQKKYQASDVKLDEYAYFSYDKLK